MIASLQGTIAATGKDHVVIVVGGIGYKVFVARPTLERLDHNEAFLHTLMIVREDAITLYGFASLQERDVFEILIGVTGVGPKLAIAILSTLSIDHLRSAVASDQAEILTRVPGIGKKTAQKIILDVKDKLGIGMDAIPGGSFDSVNSDVLDTLVALGYSIVEAQSAIQSLPLDAPDNVEERVRLALQYFM